MVNIKQNSTLSKRSVTKNNSSHVDQEDQAALGSLPALDPQSDQAISHANSTRGPSDVRPDPGLKPQASSDKPQASSCRRQAFEPTCSSIKRQASSPRQQASSVKPQASSSLIREPWYMDIGEVLGGKGPRAFTMINVLSG